MGKNRPVKRTDNYRGCKLAIEFEAGDVVHGTDEDGNPTTHVFTADYGFFPGAIFPEDSDMPNDGQDLDFFRSYQDSSADVAYALVQRRRGTRSQIKIVLGARNELGAKETFFAHRPKEMFGGVYGTMSVAALREALANWNGTLPLEKRSMPSPALPPPNHEIRMPQGILQTYADIDVSPDQLSTQQRRVFDSIREFERGMPTQQTPALTRLRGASSRFQSPMGEVRMINEAERTIDFVSSTSAIDRYDTIIKQNWRLENYRAMPIVLWCHDCRGLPVGSTIEESLRVDRLGSDDALYSTVKVLTAKENPLCEWIFQCYATGALRAISVRFDPASYTWEQRENRQICVYDAPELLEQSLCTVPGNASTLATRDIRDRMLAALDRAAVVLAPARSFQPANVNPAPAGQTRQKENSSMKIRSAASPAQQSHLIRSGELHIGCPGCHAELELEVPEVRTIEAKAEEVRKERDGERTRAIEAEKRLDTSNARVVQLDATIGVHKKTIEDMTRDLETARTESATARKDADLATRKTAMLELSRLVGPGQHQITPAERDTLADLAVEAPKQYEKLIAERAAKYRVATGTDPLLGGDLDNLRIPKDPTPQFTRNLDGVDQAQVPPGAPPSVPHIQQDLRGAPAPRPALFSDLMNRGLDSTKPVNVPTNAVRTN